MSLRYKICCMKGTGSRESVWFGMAMSLNYTAASAIGGVLTFFLRARVEPNHAALHCGTPGLQGTGTRNVRLHGCRAEWYARHTHPSPGPLGLSYTRRARSSQGRLRLAHCESRTTNGSAGAWSKARLTFPTAHMINRFWTVVYILRGGTTAVTRACPSSGLSGSAVWGGSRTVRTNLGELLTDQEQ